MEVVFLSGARARAQAVDAGAQSDARSGDAEVADASDAIEVVVTATRSEEPLKRSAIATQVITREQIERSGARNAAELLATMPALQMRESFRGVALWLRGLDPQYTLILIDGERIPGRIDGAVDLSRFGVERIERVEIVRGPSSALYGSEAIAGVVNIIARESRARFQSDALVSYGSRNVYDATGFVAGRPHDTLRLSATGGYHHADAFRLRGVDGTAGSERKQWSSGGTVRFDPNSKHRLTVAGDYSRLSMTGVDQAAGNAMLDRRQVQEQTSLRLAQRYTHSARFRWDNRAGYGQFRDQYLLDQRGGTALDKYEQNREQLGTFSSLFRFQRLAWWTSTVGVDLLYQHLRSPRLVSTSQRERIAIFGEHDFRILQRGEGSLMRLVVGVRYDIDSQFGRQFSPKVALRIDPHDTVVLRLSYGRGFQAPSFQQLYLRFENPSVGYVVNGNPHLKAESSHGVDLSAEWTPSDMFMLSVALFRNDLSQMIASVTQASDAGGTVYSYDNLSKAWTMGAESALRVQFKEIVTLQGSYALTFGRDLENQRVLPGRARHLPTAQLRLAHPKWGLSGLVRGSVELGRRFFLDDDGDGKDELQKPGALWRANVRVEQRIGKHVELFLGIDNLANDYDSFTWLRPRTYYGGVRGRY